MTPIPISLRLPLVTMLILTNLRGAEPQPPNPVETWLNKKVPQLLLADGKIFKDVTFTKIEPDAITITHSGGVQLILMELLRPESQKALGYDPEKAAKARSERINLTQKLAEEQAKTAEMQAFQNEAANFENRFDKFKNRNFFFHRDDPGSRETSLAAYISQSATDASDAYLFLKVTYRGEDWIFMDQVIFAGGKEPVPYEFDADNEVPDGGALLHEWASVPIVDVPTFIKVIEGADSFRLSGKYSRDYDLSETERRVLLQTAKFFEKLKP